MKKTSPVVFFLVFVIIPGNAGLECFSCDDVQHPFECNVSKTCDDVSQVCITAENVNDDFQLSYKLGCASAQFCDNRLHLFGKAKRNLRHNCCSNNFCNKYDITTTTRRTTTLPTTQTTIITHDPRSLRCFSCDDVQHPFECNVTQTCDNVNQVCITAENVNDDFMLSYKLGCAFPEICDNALNLFWKRKRNLRHSCCSNNLCNKYDITTTTKRTTTPLTTTTTTATTTQTTIPTHDRRSLQCFSCDDVQHPFECNVSKVCDDVNEVCITAENVNDDFRLSYKLGCASPQICDHKFSLKRKRNLLQFCCTNSFCNKYDITTTTKQISSIISTTATLNSQPLTTTHNSQPLITTILNSQPLTTTHNSQPLITTTHIPTNQTSCSGASHLHWVHSCYFLQVKEEPWNSNKGCSLEGMKKAVIETFEEHQTISYFIRRTLRYHGTVWLGASHQSNGTWHWINGQTIAVDDRRWNVGDGQKQGCLALFHGHWYSLNCDAQYSQLCEAEQY